MLSAVEFDDQPCLETDEIRIVRTDRVLTPESKALESSSAQQMPHAPFGIGLIPS